MLLDDHVKKFETEFEAADHLFQKESGTYLLTLEQTVELIPQREGFRLRSLVGECPESAPDLVANLMLANLLGQGTGGCALSLSSDEKRIFLHRDVEHDIPYVEFKELVEAFLNFTTYWKGKLSS